MMKLDVRGRRAARRSAALRASVNLRRCCVVCGRSGPASRVPFGGACLDCRRWESLEGKLQTLDDGVLLSRFCLHC